MPWHAVAALDDAINLSRGFLLPFDLRRWLALAFVVFFMGWGANAPTGISNAAKAVSGPRGTGPSGPVSGLPDGAIVAGGILVAVALLLGLAFAIMGAVMRFVFFDALHTGQVRVRDRFRAWFGAGLRLFAFGAALFIAVVGPVVAILIGVVLLGFGGPAIVFVGLPAVLVLAIVVGAVLRLTYDFVVPTMMIEETGVLGGWRRFWRTLWTTPGQFGVYVFVRWVLGIVAGVASAVAFGFLVLPVLLLGGLVEVAGMGFDLVVSPTLLVLVAVLGVPVLVGLLVVGLFLQVAIQTFFGYYALVVLGAVDPALDLVAERRASVRDGR